MEQNLQKLFKGAIYQPERRLSGDIWHSIQTKSNRISHLKTFGYFVAGILSLSGSIFSIKNLIVEFNQLGFFNYLSLMFSDGGVIAIYWKEYTLTLLDSLPMLSIIISFILLFVLSISIKNLFSQIKNKLLIA